MFTTKTNNHRTAAIFTIVALFLTLGFTTSLKAQMSPPTIPDLTKKLQSFIGTWEGTGTMTMGDMKHNMKITHITESAADGWGLLNTEINEMDGMQTYRAVNTFGYDANVGLTHLYTVSNYGECHDHKGKWTDENNLKLQHDGMMDGKPMTEVINITLDSPTQYHFTGTTTVGGEQVSYIEATMKKQK